MRKGKYFLLIIFFNLFFLLFPTLLFAQPVTQTIQINTHFRSVEGSPVWLLILRDADTGVVQPYMYDVLDNDNHWIALSGGRNYIITASSLKFGPFAIIHNFCHLEDGILAGKSMIIRLTGNLTPNRFSSQCKVIKYKGNAFHVATLRTSTTEIIQSTQTEQVTTQPGTQQQAQEAPNALPPPASLPPSSVSTPSPQEGETTNTTTTKEVITTIAPTKTEVVSGAPENK